jgi:hypothetical protein
MSSPIPSTTGHPTPQQQPPPSSQPRRPIQREGAFRIENLTAAEQALNDAMDRLSSPPPEVLGKRTCGNGSGEGSDSEPDEDSPRNGKQGALVVQAQSSQPSISNVTASTLRYASKKKLRPEQRDELDAFILVSFSIHFWSLCLIIRKDTALGRQAKLLACVFVLENKLDTIWSAAPPYQLSEELPVKACLNIVLFSTFSNLHIDQYQ